MTINYATKGLKEKSQFDSRVNIKDTVEYLRFSTSFEKSTVGISYVSAPGINVSENVLINDVSHDIDKNSLEGQRDFLKLTDTFSLDYGVFWVSDIFIEKDGEDIPLYLWHDLSHVSNISDIQILDSSFSPISRNEWLFLDETSKLGEERRGIYTNNRSYILW